MAKRAVSVKATTNAQAFQRMLRPQAFPRDETTAIQWMLERTLMELSMSRFEWSGMEELGVNVRWMEMALNFTALSVFRPTDSPELFGERYEALRAGPGTGLTRTGDPTSYWLYGMDGSPSEEVKAADCVPIWANQMRIPDYDIITIYAKRMAQMDRTIEINAIQARHSKVLKTTTNTSTSIQNIRTQLESGASAVEIDTSSIDPIDAVTVLDLGVDPDQIINMHMLRTREWGEVMTLLGINISNQDKKERLTAAETAGNDDVIATIREKNLKAREFACNQINEKWGLNVSVTYTTDMVTATTKDVDADGDTVDANEQQNAQKVGA